MDLQELSEKIEKIGNIVKTSQLYAIGLTQRQITSLVDKEFLTRVKSGYYKLTDLKMSDDETILSLFPDGILTMESALYTYGYLKRKPLKYSIAISKNTSKSRFKMKYPPVRPYFVDEPYLSMGVEGIDFAGGFMKIYDKERLICEVLKYEDYMSRDDVKSAITSYIKEKNHDLNRLTEYAIKRHVKNKVEVRLGDWL